MSRGSVFSVMMWTGSFHVCRHPHGFSLSPSLPGVFTQCEWVMDLKVGQWKWANVSEWLNIASCHQGTRPRITTCNGGREPWSPVRGSASPVVPTQSQSQNILCHEFSCDQGKAFSELMWSAVKGELSAASTCSPESSIQGNRQEPSVLTAEHCDN
jgi:hypothetical protein